MERIRFVRPDDSRVFVSARQYLQFYEDGAARELQARPLMVLEKKDGLWEIVTLQNTRITEVGAPEKDDRANESEHFVKESWNLLKFKKLAYSVVG